MAVASGSPDVIDRGSVSQIVRTGDADKADGCIALCLAAPFPPGRRLTSRVRAPQRARQLWIVALATTVALAGCTIPIHVNRPPNLVDPEVSGLVTSVSPIAGSSSTVTVDGRQFEVDLEGRRVARLYTGLAEGGVVLYGSQPRPWYIGTPPPYDGCYLVHATAAFDDPDAVILVFRELGTGIGIRVPKAPGFNPGTELLRDGPNAGEYLGWDIGPQFCLDAEGRVNQVSGGPPPASSP